MRRRTVLKAMVVGGTMAGAIGRVAAAGIEREGHGRLRAMGPVILETPHGVVTGDAGTVRW